VPSTETVTRPLDDLYIFSSVRKYAFDYLSGEHAEPTARPVTRARAAAVKRPPAPAPVELVRSANTCPICLSDIADCRGH
jgi:phosphopantothenate synthetase